MNPNVWVLVANGMLSFKREIKIIFATLCIIMLLPIGLAIVVTQLGFGSISSVLASTGSGSTPQNISVDIHDPGTGKIVDTITGPAMWPVSGVVTLEFGAPDPPYQPLHTGIDIADPNHQVGTPVAAFMAGTVTYSGSLTWGFGTHVEIDNGHHVTSIYGHLNTLTVVVGQQVKMGDIIGTRGSTGWSTGPHTHFQINVFGIPVDPRIFLKGNP